MRECPQSRIGQQKHRHGTSEVPAVLSQVSLGGQTFVARQIHRQFNGVDQKNDFDRRLGPRSATMECLEREDVLWLAVLEQIEIRTLKAGDGLSTGIRDYDVQLDKPFRAISGYRWDENTRRMPRARLRTGKTQQTKKHRNADK